MAIACYMIVAPYDPWLNVSRGGGVKDADTLGWLKRQSVDEQPIPYSGTVILLEAAP